MTARKETREMTIILSSKWHGECPECGQNPCCIRASVQLPPRRFRPWSRKRILCAHCGRFFEVAQDGEYK